MGLVDGLVAPLFHPWRLFQVNSSAFHWISSNDHHMKFVALQSSHSFDPFAKFVAIDNFPCSTIFVQFSHKAGA